MNSDTSKTTFNNKKNFLTGCITELTPAAKNGSFSELENVFPLKIFKDFFK